MSCFPLQMCLVIGAIFGVVVYRIIMVAVFYTMIEKYDLSSEDVVASLLTSLTASIINLLAILILSVVSNTLQTVAVYFMWDILPLFRLVYCRVPARRGL